VEEAACARPEVAGGVAILARPQLARGVASGGLAAGELAQPLEALGQHVGVPLVPQEAVVDRCGPNSRRGSVP
jgi:hypothetical protein